MRRKLTRSAIALALLAVVLLDLLGWLVVLLNILIALTGIGILAAHAARPLLRPLRQARADRDFWGFAGASRLD